HVEMFFDPQAHTSRGVPFADVIGGYRQGLLAARRDLGISAELILCMLRDFTAEHAMSTLMEALDYKDWIIGIGLDSDEHGHPPEKFTEVFSRARQEGFQLTMHCDVDQENSIGNIRTVLQEIGVDRVDHGTNVLEDAALVDRAVEQGIGFTACLLSKNYFDGHTKGSVIPALLRRGEKLTVKSVDPALFGGYIGDIYAALAERDGFSREQLAQIARNSLEVSWLSESRRQEFLARLV